MGSVLLSGQGEAAAATVVVAAASLTGLTRTAQGVGLRTHQGVDESCQQLAQHIGAAGGESISQHSRPVNIVASGHRVDSFARVTLVGPSTNHAIAPATMRPAPSPELARRPATASRRSIIRAGADS